MVCLCSPGGSVQVFVLISPQNVVGSTVMTNLGDMVRVLPCFCPLLKHRTRKAAPSVSSITAVRQQHHSRQAAASQLSGPG